MKRLDEVVKAKMERARTTGQGQVTGIAATHWTRLSCSSIGSSKQAV